MAELQSLLLFVNYDNQRSERIVLPRNNPFDDYDEKKFRERFRLSKFAVMKLLDEVRRRTLYNALTTLHYTFTTTAPCLQSKK